MIGDRLVVGFLALNQKTEVRPLLPELVLYDPCLEKNDPGQLLLVVTPGSEPGGRWFDSNPRSFTEAIRPDEEPVLKTGDGFAVCGFESHGFRLLGSWSNRTTPASHAGDPGATPGDSTPNTTVPWSSGEDAWPTSRKPMVQFHPGPLEPRYANWKSGLA